MKILSIIYFTLYLSYVFLGEHFIVKLIKKDKLNILNNRKKLIRIFFLSYISFLYIGFFFLQPTIELFVLSLIVSLISLIFYIVKFYGLREIDPYYYSGIYMHFLTIIPLIVFYFIYKLNIKNYKFGYISLGTFIFLILYSFFDNLIYKKGENLFF